MRALAALVVCCTVILMSGIAVTAGDSVDRDLISPVSPPELRVSPQGEAAGTVPDYSLSVMADKSGRANYNCVLKVYIAEQVSRWKDNTNYYHYEFGFLDFAVDTALSLGYLETYQTTKIWDGAAGGYAGTSDSGFYFLREDNIMAIAAVFNSENGGIGHSDPPSGYPFTIHTVDACAAATPGNPGYDTAYGAFTHTVFVEEGTSHT